LTGSTETAVAAFLASTAGTLLSEFTEIESGRKKNRPQLKTALLECRSKKATLIIAKLDRLAKNLHFISGLMESNVDFIAVDNPNANGLTLQILAAVAEDEARRISERTKSALAAAKARGTLLGIAGHARAEENRSAAREFAENLAPLIREIQANGTTTAKAIADELNRRGVSTPKGGRWHPTSVQRLQRRLRNND
jgi:DNA invertase Pin-like site-specific DNA recombinase